MEKLKYGKYEYERSYLLDSRCLDARIVLETKEIFDSYLPDTSLRLRKVVSNKLTKYKLTQKKEIKQGNRGVLQINTIYLTESEFGLLNNLNGVCIVKTRHIIEAGQTRIAIDQITLPDNTLFIAEVEFETEDQMNAFSMPIPVVREVTGDKKYNGFTLAQEYSNYFANK